MFNYLTNLITISKMHEWDEHYKENKTVMGEL